MKYEHIKDCWQAVRDCKTYEELITTLENFPRWSGDWEIIPEAGYYTVVNTYFDEQCETYDSDSEALDIPVEVEIDDEIELDDYIPTYQVWGFWLDEDQQVLTDILLREYNEPEEAIKYAKLFTENLTDLRNGVDKDVKYYEVLVETVVDFGEYKENVNTLYRDLLEV
jgi:hypothetical protein